MKIYKIAHLKGPKKSGIIQEKNTKKGEENGKRNRHGKEKKRKFFATYGKALALLCDDGSRRDLSRTV